MLKSNVKDTNLDLIVLQYNYGCLQKLLGNYTKALDILEKVLKTQLKVLSKNHPNISDTYLALVHVYSSLEDRSKVLEYLKECIEHAPISILPFNQVKFQFFQEQYDIFKAEYFLSNEETRETIYLQAEKFNIIDEQDCLLTLSIEELQRTSLNNTYERIRLLSSIGTIYSRKTNYETAANVFDDAMSTYNQRQALALINEQTLNELMVVVYFNSAGLYYRLKNWPIALQNLEKSLNLAFKQDQ